MFEDIFPGTRALALLGIVLALAGCGGGGGGQSPTPAPRPRVATPLTIPGPYSVACSNVEQDFSRLAPGEDATDYWKGAPSTSGAPRYVTDLLADPADTLAVTVTAPHDATLYGAFMRKPMAYVVLVCYPTSADNPRADYPLPDGGAVPHMQAGADAPLFADAAARYPLILFSHGISGSPISGEYLSAISAFASYGYVVAAPFHGDQRISDASDLGNAIALLAHINPFTALQSLRPLSLSATIDLMLAHPQWRDHIDAAQIGGFGVSIGGESLMLMGGAGLTSSPMLSWTQVAADRRLKAAVGYLPYFGTPFLPAFGRDQQGLDGVTLPYLAISGTADTTAPLSLTQKGMALLAGTRELVALNGTSHLLDAASASDVFSWSLIFLDAQVRGDAAARENLSVMKSVAGGADDSVVIHYNGPH